MHSSFIFSSFIYQQLAAERVDHLFGKMDLDGNGEISEEEFIKRCMEDEYLVGMSISVYSIKALEKGI